MQVAKYESFSFVNIDRIICFVVSWLRIPSFKASLGLRLGFDYLSFSFYSGSLPSGCSLSMKKINRVLKDTVVVLQHISNCFNPLSVSLPRNNYLNI